MSIVLPVSDGSPLGTGPAFPALHSAASSLSTTRLFLSEQG